MAAAVTVAPVMPHRATTPPPHLSLNTSSRGTPAAVPNKHLPICSPGPRPNRGLETPPASPPSKELLVDTSSTLYPPENFLKIVDKPPVFSITARTLKQAVDNLATQCLPDPHQVFPWLHGLHPENNIQLSYFTNRRKSLRKTPQCLRGLTVIKVGGDLSRSKLKGAVAPEELLWAHTHPEETANFLEVDPREGFSVRNFQIQACKMATVSDLVIYGDDNTSHNDVVTLARKFAWAQKVWREKEGGALADFNTFVLSDSFSDVERDHPELVAIDSNARMTGNVMDFFHWERVEMCTMSKATEISRNVFLGPTPDSALELAESQAAFDVYIEASDLAPVPDRRTLKALRAELNEDNAVNIHMEFPSSGSIMPPTLSHAEVDGLMDMCKWIYDVANSETPEESSEEHDDDGDSIMLCQFKKSSKILIHCTDGYTESSLLGLAYFMYAEGLTVHEAWVQLHREKGRNFFAYPSDVALLIAIQPRILEASPRWRGNVLEIKEPRWLTKIDGSLPSRILPYMYLGNLGHANNPELLKELGISRILSVGEPVAWSKDVNTTWPNEDMLYIDGVQDNGVDPLTSQFDRCLKFIERGKFDGKATLVHCRVGVSRSATICIAEVMNELGLSFPRAYCFVRARRLNVIIQPHLRFTYELIKWEEQQQKKRGLPVRRELEWPTIAREIALMNKPYARQ